MTHFGRSGAVALALAVTLAACGGEGGGASPAEMANRASGGGTTTLTGAGATFPYPIYSRWFSDYAAATGVRVNYQSIGSGGGIRQLTEKTVDFGASDAPMTEEELAAAPGTVHIPTVIGAVAIPYNLPEVQGTLRLSGEALADIFLGNITRWNDPAIQALNPGVTLPARDILVIRRSDGSGTTFVLTEYLAEVSPEWVQRVGVGKAVNWPAGLGAKGNEGVTGQVKQAEGAIGYVEHVYAEQNDLPVVMLQNREGEFVPPTTEGATAAAAGAAEALQPGEDLTLSLVNAAGAGSYPITTWTYLLVPANFADCARGQAVTDLIRWTLTEGDAAALELGYAPLPENVETEALARLDALTCGADQQPLGATQ